MQAVLAFLFKFPMILQFILVFIGSFFIFILIFNVFRIIEIFIFGSKRRYIKENNDPLTGKQILLRSFVGSVIMIFIYLILIISR